jgi:hypothetical protein
LQLKIVAKQKRPEIYLGIFYAQKEVVIHMASRIQGITVEIGGDTTKLCGLYRTRRLLPMRRLPRSMKPEKNFRTLVHRSKM